MMTVDYYILQAQNSNKEEFNKHWSNVIVDVDHNYTGIFSEEGHMLKIYWVTDGRREGKYDHHHITIVNE